MELSPEQIAQNKVGDTYKRELERHSKDIVMVHNPLDKDYTCIWDKFKHVIPNCNRDIGFGKGNNELPFYIARKYFNEMKDIMVNTSNQKIVEKRIEIKEKSGANFETKWHEQTVWNNLPRTNDRKVVDSLFEELWLGIVREFGLDEVENEVPMADFKTEEEHMNDMMNKKFMPSTSPEAVEQTIKTGKPSIKEITND
jgi:hypothetical protein